MAMINKTDDDPCKKECREGENLFIAAEGHTGITTIEINMEIS